jgi:hypothetical protein
VRARQGRLSVPPGPGLGLDPDMEVLNRYRLGPPGRDRKLTAFTAGDRPRWVESSRAMSALEQSALGN